MDRNKKILSWIRRDLRRRKIEIPDPQELYDECNRVQRYIIQEMGSIEREIPVNTVAHKETYDLIDESGVTILDFWNSYDKRMELVTDHWSEKRNATGSDPYYIFISSGKLYLSPIPIRDNDVITFLVKQTDIVNEMDEDIEPEIPKEMDEALVLGVDAQYDESFEQKYLFTLEKLKGNLATEGVPTYINGTW